MIKFGQVTWAFSIVASAVSNPRIISGTWFSFLLFGSTIKSVKTVMQNDFNGWLDITFAISNSKFNSNFVSALTLPNNKSANIMTYWHNFIFQQLKTDWIENALHLQQVTFSTFNYSNVATQYICTAQTFSRVGCNLLRKFKSRWIRIQPLFY